MKVIIPTKNRAQSIKTHKVFDGEDVYILVHDDDQYGLYASNSTIDKNTIVVTGVPGDTYGLTRQREWAMQNITELGEWFIFADDNIKHIEAVPEEWYNSDTITVPEKYSSTWRKRFATKCDTDRFMCIANDMASYAEDIGTPLCGFATVDNYYYRTVHWRTVGYVIGKMMVIKNVGIPYRHDISMEDFTYTAEVLLRYGRVLVNNYVRPVAGHYEKGGMGTYEERIPVRTADCKMLMSLFPGLYRPKKLRNMVPGTDLALRIHSEERIDEWRKSMRRPLSAKAKKPL